jgi:energy-coupling factor transporter transmembrane protein EcfT
MSSYYLVGIVAFMLIVYYLAKQISFANLLKEGEKITSTALGGFETIVKFLIIVLTIVAATYALQKLLGTGITQSPWYWILMIALLVVFLVNWLEKKTNINIVKTIAITIGIMALFMIIVWTIWPGKNLKKMADEIREKPKPICAPRDISWMTFKITPVKQDLFRVYAGDTIYYFAQKGFWVEYEDGNKYFNNPSYNGQMMEFTITTADEKGEIARVWNDETLQLKYRVKSRG